MYSLSEAYKEAITPAYNLAAAAGAEDINFQEIPNTHTAYSPSVGRPSSPSVDTFFMSQRGSATTIIVDGIPEQASFVEGVGSVGKSTPETTPDQTCPKVGDKLFLDLPQMACPRPGTLHTLSMSNDPKRFPGAVGSSCLCAVDNLFLAEFKGVCKTEQSGENGSLDVSGKTLKTGSLVDTKKAPEG